MESSISLVGPAQLQGIGRAILGSNWREAARLVKGAWQQWQAPDDPGLSSRALTGSAAVELRLSPVDNGVQGNYFAFILDKLNRELAAEQGETNASGISLAAFTQELLRYSIPAQLQAKPANGEAVDAYGNALLGAYSEVYPQLPTLVGDAWQGQRSNTGGDAALTFAYHLEKKGAVGSLSQLAVTGDSAQPQQLYTLNVFADAIKAGHNLNSISLRIQYDSSLFNPINASDVRLPSSLGLARSVQIDHDAGFIYIEAAANAIDSIPSGVNGGKPLLASIDLDFNETYLQSLTPNADGTYSVGPLSFEVLANKDETILSTQFADAGGGVNYEIKSLKELGGVYGSGGQNVTLYKALITLEERTGMVLGTQRLIGKDAGFTNLVRQGDRLTATSTWQNSGNVAANELTAYDSGQNLNAYLRSYSFSGQAVDGGTFTNGTYNPLTRQEVTLTASIDVTGSAGSVIDLTQGLFKVKAQGSEGFSNRFGTKNLITFQGDLNYDGRVSMKDLVYLNAGAARQQRDSDGRVIQSTVARDVDADFSGEIDLADLAVLDRDWGRSLHSGSQHFRGDANLSWQALDQQTGASWVNTAFKLQNAAEAATGFIGSLTPVGSIDNQGPSFAGAVTSSDGRKVILNYSESLGATAAPASAFTVKIDGVSVVVTATRVSAATVELTLDSIIKPNQIVTVAYAAPAASGLSSNAAIQDLIGNDASSLAPRTVANLSTVDGTAPVVSSIVYSDTQGPLALGETVTLTVTMSEAVNVSATPTIRLANGGVAQYTGGTGTNTLTFSYTAGAGQATDDLVTATTNAFIGSITDLSGNSIAPTAFNNINPVGTLAVDVAAPLVTSITYGANDGTLSLGEAVTLNVTLSEAVTVTGVPTLALANGGTASYTGGTGTNILSFRYIPAAGQTTADLATAETNAFSGTITDLAGNAIATAGFNNVNPSGTLAVDVSAAQVSSIAYGANDGVLAVGEAISLTVTLNKAVNVSGTPTLALANGGIASYTGGTGTNTLTFSYSPVAGQSIDDLATAASNAFSGTITDLAGNAIATSGFNNINPAGTVAVDATVAVVSSVAYGSNDGKLALGETVTLTVTMSEMVKVTGTPTLTLANGGVASYVSGHGSNTLIFSYTAGPGQTTADLATATANALTGSITDLAGNPVAAAGFNNLNPAGTLAVDDTAPTLSSSTPTPAATAVALANNILLSFNEAVTAGTGNIVISNGTDTRTIAVSDTSQVTINGNTVTINPTADLQANSLYNVQVASGALRDLAGNAYAGISSTSALSFTTTSQTTGSGTSFVGTDFGAGPVSVATAITLKYSADIRAGSGNIVISNATDTRTISITDASQVAINGNTITINPLADFNANSSYSIAIGSGVVADAAGNALAAIGTSSPLQFTTGNVIYAAPLSAGSNTSGSGTSASPYQSIEYASTRAVAGDTIYVVNQTTAVSRSYDLKAQGTATSPIVIKPVPGSSAKYTFDSFTGFTVNGANNLIIEGFEFYGKSDQVSVSDILANYYWDQAGKPAMGGIAINVASGNNITIRDNYFHDLEQKAVNIENGRYVEITNNIIHDVATKSVSGGHAIMRQQGSGVFGTPDVADAYRWEISGNLIYNVQQRIYSWVPSKGYANFVLDEGKPINIDETSDTAMKALIADNIIAFNTIDGIRLKSTANLEVLNNSIYTAPGAVDADGITDAATLSGGGNQFPGLVVRGNAVMSGPGTLAFELSDGFATNPNNATLSNNAFSGGGTAPLDNPASSSDGLINLGPGVALFTNPMTGDFSLRSGLGLGDNIGVSPATLLRIQQQVQAFGVTFTPSTYRDDPVQNTQLLINSLPGSVFNLASRTYGNSVKEPGRKSFFYSVVPGQESKNGGKTQLEIILPDDYAAFYEGRAVNEVRVVAAGQVLASAAALGVLSNDGGTNQSVSTFRTGLESGSGTSVNAGQSLIGSYGTLTINADGSYSYVANHTAAAQLQPGAIAKDIFTYTRQAQSAAGVTDQAQLEFVVVGTAGAVADTTAPVFKSAATSTDGSKLVLTFSEALATTTAPASAFSVNVAGVSRAVSSFVVNGSTVELTLATAVKAGEVVTVGYTDPTSGNDSNAIQDLAGNDAATVAATTAATNRVAGAAAAPSTTPPPAPVITLIYDDQAPVLGSIASGAVTNDTMPSLTITAATGSTVRVFDNGALVGLATETSTAGTYSFTPNAALWAGSHSFTAKASDLAGNISTASSAVAIAVGVTGDGLSAGTPTNLTLTLAGRDSHADTAFTLVAGGYPIAGTTQDIVFESLDWKLTSGAWSIKAGWNAVAADIPSLPAGVQFRVKVKSDAGSSGTVLYTSNPLIPATTGLVLPAVDNTAPATPAIVSTSTVAGLMRPTLTINAQTGSTVRVFDGASLLGTATETATPGTFSFTPTSNLSGEAHSFYVRAIDEAGNSSSFSEAFSLLLTVDTTPPTVAITSSSTSLGIGQTATITFTLSEATTDLSAADIDVTGGSLSSFTGSGSTYSAIFTPTANSRTQATIKIASGRFSDLAGNLNADGSDADNTFNIDVNTVPLQFSVPAAVSVAENTAYTATTPSLSGAVGTVTWSLSGEDASKFTVNSSTGVVSMVARDFEAPLDTGTDNTYSYTLTATDSRGAAGRISQAVTVSITNANEASLMSIGNISSGTIAENTPYLSSTPTVSGALGTVSWSLEGDDASKFSVDTTTGVVSMVARDYEQPADVGANNTYNVTLKATDSNGNSATQALVLSVTDLEVEAGASPSSFSLAKLSPTDSAVDIAVDSNLVLTFTKAITRGTGTIELRSGSASGSVVESYDVVTSTRLTINDTTLTIDPTNNLSVNTTYFLVVPGGAIRDSLGNPYSGTSAWDFKTIPALADTTAPTITSFSPTTGATAVALGSDLQFSFSEGIRRGNGTIELRSGSATGAVVETFNTADSARLAITSNTLTLNPGADLNPGTTYAVVFAAGSIQDLAGNNFAGSVTHSFTTTAALSIAAVNDNVGASTGEVANGATTDDTTPTLSGSLAAALANGESLRVLRNGAFVDTASVAGTSWSWTPTTPLSAGNHSFSVALVDANGSTLAQSTPRSFVVALSISGLSSRSLSENSVYSSETPTVLGAIGPVTWSLEGEDASRFTVNASTGVVSMVARDYEVPVDVGANNSYNYTLKATDKAGNTATQAVAISITNSTSGDNSPPTGEVLITGAYQSGQTLKASSFIRYNSYLTGTATRISTAGTVADFDPINSTFVMEGGWVGVDSNDTRGAAAIVRNVDTSVAGQLTFWVMAFDDNKTKAVQVRLANMSGGGVSAQALAAKDTTGDQRSTTFNFDTGGNFSTLATSDSADGLGVRSSNWSSLPALSDLDGVGTLQYQWYADGVAISGATGRSYTLTSNEIGKTVNLRVSYTDSAGKSEVVETSPQRVQWGTTSSIGSNLLLSNNGSNLQTSSGRNTGSVLATSELGDVVVYSRVDASAITLNAGQTYYIEVHHLEGGGGDHVAVGWKLPGASTITDVTGTFTEQRWSGATAYNNQDWSATPTATSSLTTLATAQGVGDNYSRRIVGTFTAPTSGTYTFYIASDDGSRLYLGTSSDPSSKGTDPIATVPDNGYTGYKEWTKFPSQAGTSVSVSSFIAVDSNTGTNQILNRSVASGSSASSTPSEFKGISADGRYAVLAVSQVSGYGNGTAFTDTNSVTSGISDLIVFDRTTGTVKLATWSADQTTSNSQNASFLGITSNSQYLIYRTDFANKIGSFTRSGITDGTASADLIAYNLATGVQTLLTHGTLAGQSLGAGIETAMLSNDGQFVLFTAKDGTKLGQGASTFTDNAPTVADLYAVRISDGDIRLLSRAMGESNVTASTPLTLLGQSGDGAYAVIRAADTSKFGLIDSNPNTTDLLSINIATGAIRPLNHPTGNSSTTTNSNPTFVAAIGDYVYFTVQDATTLSVAADGSTTKNDLFRTHVATGEVRLLSRDLTDSTKAMDGNFVPGSLVVSSNDRYVAFTSSVPTSAGGDAVFVVDTQTNTIKQVNGGYSLWGGARPNTFADGDSKLVISLQSAGWLGQGFTGDDGQKAIVSYDFLTNTYSLLSHNSTLLNKSFGSAATYRGISADGKTVYFTAADATKFGNSGTAFTDSNTTADDVFAVNVTTGVIELVSGINGASLGTAGSFAGTTALGDLLYTSGNVNNLTALSGVMSDSSTSNSDLVASRFALLDLATVSDSKGGEDGSNTDNVTTKRDLILRARVAANQVVQLLDNGAPIATGQVTADSQGVVNWTLTNVALGSHSYSLIDSTTKAPLQLGTRTGSGSLTVVVKADTTGPSLLSSTPSNGASAVAVGANIVLTFSEAIQKGTGSVRLYSTDSSSPALSFDVGSDAISLSGTTLTVNPPADLSSSKTYYITIDPGAITDLSGNAFSGINDPLTVRFKTPDTAAPIFTSAAKAQVLERQSKIYSAVANDSVSTTNGKVVYSLKAATGDVTQLAINANTGDVSLKEGVSSAAVKGQYSFTVIATDAVGNASEQAIVVTVDPSPALVSSNPSDNAVSVSALGNNIVITFSEPVQQNLRVAEASTQGRFVRIELAGESKQIALSELQVLSGGVNVALNKTATQSSTEYWSGGVASRAVDGSLGSNEILTDRQANPFWEVDLGSSYTIEAINLFNSKGYPKSLAGATLSILDANRQLIDQRILPAEPGALETYTFQSIDSRTIRLYSQDGVLIQSFDTSSANPNITVSGNTLSINPSADLQANTGYYLLIDPQAIRDQGGNTFAGLSTTSQLNFRTGAPDTTAPSLVTSNPTDGRSDFGVGQNLSFTFSEAIEAGFGFLNLYRADGTLVEGFDLASSSRALFSGKTLTINPTWALESGLEHYIQIDNGAIRDVSGNLYAGVSDNITLNFLTAPESWNDTAEAFTRDNFPGNTIESIGDHRMLLFRVAFADQSIAPWYSYSSGYVNDVQLTDVFWAKGSYGRMSLSSTETPLIKLNQTWNFVRDVDAGDGVDANNPFSADFGNNLGNIHEQAVKAAQRLGYNVNNYDVRVAGNSQWTRRGASWGGGNFVWNGWDGFSTLAHEAGHALGFGHANWLRPDGVVGEYGNIFDIMGNGGSVDSDYWIKQKLDVGWLNPSQIATNPQSGSYRIYAHDEGVALNDQLYGLAVGGTRKYYLEYRNQLSEGRLSKALLVVRDDDSLIDALPVTPDNNAHPYAGIDIARTYKIPDQDTYITVLAQGDGYLDVAVRNGPFSSNVNPTASFTATASQVKTRDSITFSATGADSNGDELVYAWWFSDNVAGSGATFTRTFDQATAGTITAKLIVSDLKGGTATVEQAIAVAAASTANPVTVGALTSLSTSKPLVSIQASDAFATEGTSDTASLLISRFGTALTNPLTVKLTYSGSALNQVAAGSLPATVTIAANQRSVSVPISFLDNATLEAVRQLTVNVAADSAYDVSAQNTTAVINLFDNDRTVVSIEAVDKIASENGRDSAAFRISRTGSTTEALKVYYSAYGTAYNGSDYQTLNGEITILAGESAAVVLIQPVNDGVGEQTETVNLILSSISTAYDVNRKAASASIALLDNDAPLVSLYADSYTKTSILEGSTTPARFVVMATGRPGSTVSVDYTIAGTATSGVDYTAPSSSVSITIGKDGLGKSTIEIPIINDTTQEVLETIQIALKESPSYQIDSNNAATFVINDNDSAGPIVMVSPFMDTQVEGGTTTTGDYRNGQGRFYISRNTDDNRPVNTGTLTVSYTISGTASPGSDFTGLTTGTVTIPDGAPGAIVRFTPVDDAIGEGSESVVLTINSSSSYRIGASGSAAMWIDDNDTAAITVGFESLFSRVSETQDSLLSVRDVVVKLSGASATPISVTAVAGGGTATGDGVDWTFLDPVTNKPVSTPTITFAPGETSKILRLQAIADAEIEINEVAQIDLIRPTNATLTSGAQSHSLFIDDAPAGGDQANRYVRLLTTGSVLRESAGADPMLMVALDRPAGATPITVELQLGGTASRGSDYNLTTTTLTFQPGEVSKAVPLTLLNDALAEAPESIQIGITRASGAIVSGPPVHDIVLVDANAPTIQSAKAWVNGAPAAGTIVTTVSATPASGRTISGWQIMSGNAIRDGQANPAFSITNSGQVVIANTNSLPIGPTAIQLVVRATDNQGAASDNIVSLVVNGQRVFEETRWLGTAPFDNQDWSETPIYRGALSTSASASNVDDNYSRRITGLLEPTTTGDYTFWVAGDDRARLYLGSDQSEASKQQIAMTPDWTNADQFTKYPEQQSRTVRLEAGQRYWLEAQQVEASVGDHVAIAWQGPGMASRALITEANLAPIIPGMLTEQELKAAATYKPAVQTATISSVIGTDSGLTSTINSGSRTRDRSLALSGTVDAGSTVQIFDGTTLLGKATVTGNTWNFSTPELVDGTHNLVAQVVDQVGNVRITPAVEALVNSQIELGANRLLSPSSSNALSTSNSAVGSVLGSDASGSLLVVEQVKTINLVAGQTYYIEVQHLEGGGGDHVEAGWKLPGASSITSITGSFTEKRWSGPNAYNTQTWSGTPSYTGSLTTLASAVGVGDDYSRLITGTFVAPVSGNYTFFLASDDQSRLYLGTGSTADTKDPSPIATVNDWTNVNEWTKSPSQQGSRYPSSTVYELLDTATGTRTLINRSATSTSQAALATSEYKGISADGRYVVFAATDVSRFGNSGTTFTDGNTVSNGLSDLLVFDRTTNTVKLATWSGNQTTSLSQQASFVGITSDNQYLVYKSDYANKIGSFTRSGITDTTASTDLIAYNLSTGAQSLLTHGSTASQSLGAGVGHAVLSNDGQYVLFTANDASKLANGSTAFTDSSATTADLFAVRISDGSLKLLSRSGSSATTSAATAVTLLGQSGNGAYAIASVSDAAKLGLTDSNTTSADLLAFNIADGSIKALNHASGSNTTTTASDPTFIQAIRDYAYFTVKNATTLGASADGSTTKADLYRTQISTGTVKLLSFQAATPSAAMDGSYVSNSLVVSSDDRYVAFTSDVPTSAGGGAVFVVDTLTSTIKQVNAGYTQWGDARPQAFANGNASLIFTTKYTGYLGGMSSKSDSQNGIFKYDISTGSIALLSHSATSATYVEGSATFRGISDDGKTVFFTATDAAQFGNNGIAFTDSAPTADDLFAVDVSTGKIELVSGVNGVSLGSAISFEGIGPDGQVRYTSFNTNNLPASPSGVITDGYPATTDLIASTFELLDLSTASDSTGPNSGSNRDNITSSQTLNLSALVLPNQQVTLLDLGSPVQGNGVNADATADSNGRVSWTLSNVALGVHSYSLLDTVEKVPLVVEGRPLASTLDVTVVGAAKPASLPSLTPPTPDSDFTDVDWSALMPETSDPFLGSNPSSFEPFDPLSPTTISQAISDPQLDPNPSGFMPAADTTLDAPSNPGVLNQDDKHLTSDTGLVGAYLP